MFDLQKSSAREFIEKGKAYLSVKDVRGAEISFRTAQKLLPKEWKIFFGLGQIYALRGCSAPALYYFEKARILAPEHHEIWEMEARALRHSYANTKQKSAFLSALKGTNINSTQRNKIIEFLATISDFKDAPLGETDKKTLLRAMKLIKAAHGTQAIKLCEKLLKKKPTDGQILTQLARAYQLLGKAQKGDMAFRLALKASPQNARLHYYYARYLAAQNLFTPALSYARRAVFLIPNALYLRFLGQLLLRIRPDLSSLFILYQAQACASEDALTHSALARAYLKFNAPNLAIFHAQLAQNYTKAKSATALEIDLLCLEAEISSGVISDKNLIRLDSLVHKHPQNIAIHRVRLSAYQTAGSNAPKMHQVALDFAKAFPQNAEPYLAYVKGKKITLDAEFLQTIYAKAHNPKNSLWARAGFEYAYAKVAEDNQDYARAFAAFERGAGHMKALYEIKDDVKNENIALASEVDAVIALASEKMADFFALPTEQAVKSTKAGAMLKRNAPIFITGLPRSGTTLVEQIIASHPAIMGGGELGILPKILYGECGVTLGEMAPFHLYEQSFYDRIGTQYCDFIVDAFGKDKQLSDKSIMTFLYLGIVRKALPHAKVIIVRRDPRDNLLSIYKNIFAQGTHKYSYDLKMLAHHYTAFERMIDFWRKNLGAWFYEIYYEDLVNEPEQQTRALIDFCNLPWDASCLNFTQNKRRVKTLSAYQVRKPIYKTSVKLWQKYEKQLKPLLDILDQKHKTDRNKT